MNLRPMLLLALCLMIANPLLYAAGTKVSSGQQQEQKISGTVTDDKGETIIGATVMLKGAAGVGTATDIDGKFSFVCPNMNGTLVVSFIGYATQEIPIKGRKQIDVVMASSTTELEEVQVIAYGAQKKVTVTGAISAVKGEELMKTPVPSLGNAIVGKLSGVSAIQWSGEPGADDPQIFVRGMGTLTEAGSEPLVLVDGVEREFAQIDPNEVENITILKDASATAVFGVRGANGVILVTTKRGVEGKARISITTSVGLQVPTRLLDMANGYDYVTYANEANRLDGNQTPLYSDEMVEALRTHSDPLLYPDIDWVDYCFKKMATQTQHNVNVSGGIDWVRYFVSVGVLTQEGLFKTFDMGKDANFRYNRYNYRANLDFDLTKSTLLSVNLGGRVEDKNTPNSTEDGEQLFRHLYWAAPFAGAGIVNGKWIKSNPDYIGTTDVTDGLSHYYGMGYKRSVKNVLNLDLMLDQKLDFITKGLSVKVKGSYNSDYKHVKNRTLSTPYYTPVKQDDGSVALRKNGDDGKLGYNESFESGRNWYAEASFNYRRDFGNHHVSALALYNQSRWYYPANSPEIPSGYVGLVGRVTYDWKTKYLLDFNIGYNGSENFAPDKRFGVFPAVSVGWIVSEENFMKNQKVISYLKLRASYGVVGNDKLYVGSTAQRFLYQEDSYDYGGNGYNFGTNVSGNTASAQEGRVGNKDVTWETAKKQNYGIDIHFLDSRLKVSFDYFKDRREDILIKRTAVPGWLAIDLPAVNMGIVENQGGEISLNWDDKIGDGFNYYIHSQWSYSRNRIIEQDEVYPGEDYLITTGRRIGQPFGRLLYGFYYEGMEAQYEKDLGTPFPVHPGTLLPGDCVYVDINKDGEINSFDQRAIGHPNYPALTGSWTLGFSYKGFDFSMMWNGAWQTSRYLEEQLRYPLGDTGRKGLLQQQFDDRWTESNPNSKLPRPTLDRGRSNNYAGSDLWLKDASYIRLKNVEIGYNFNLPIMKRWGINQLRLYANGYNLLTFDSLDVVDPESRTSERPSYPLIRVFNFGLNLGF